MHSPHITGECERRSSALSENRESKSMPSVSDIVAASFHQARSMYPELNRAWIEASFKLAGRAGVMPMMIAVQRAGEIDLVLRAMEDELREGKTQDGFAFNYQVMMSETWVLASYEFLRVVRQRDGETERIIRRQGGSPASDTVSGMPEFKAVFEQLELLRMPMAKFEIAKDKTMKEPLTFGSVGEGPQKEAVYDKDDPARFHIMPAGVTPRGTIGWQAFDHTQKREFWIERRQLSDQLVDMASKVEGAGVREARLKAETAASKEG